MQDSGTAEKVGGKIQRKVGEIKKFLENNPYGVGVRSEIWPNAPPL